MTSSYADSDENFAHFEGLQTCGSVWDCPCCAARISETRRDELNQLLAWSRAQGHTVQMITLTARHGREDDLVDLLEGMKRAKQRWAQHRAYKRIKPILIGSVTATEVTGGGQHGWHPHFHVLIITSEPVDLDQLREPWLASLHGVGLDGTGEGWSVQDASAAGRYVSKWGAAEEVAFGARKKARAGMSPTQLLAASCDDDDQRAGELWREYSAAFRGRRQLVWSRGLKALAEVDNIEDDQAAQNERQDGQEEIGRAKISHHAWREGVALKRADRRAALLDRAEHVGPDVAVAELLDGVGPEVGLDQLLDDLLEPPGEEWHPRPGGLVDQIFRSQSRETCGYPNFERATRDPGGYVSEAVFSPPSPIVPETVRSARC